MKRFFFLRTCARHFNNTAASLSSDNLAVPRPFLILALAEVRQREEGKWVFWGLPALVF